ncbi:MAG TPA: alanine--glyoxylate aminotransferase family protein [Gaiellaceae bacterium]|nr:alanine--glyoxylate aminotransferase family protein [Gaiellaceae bacterium]
MPEKRYLVTPGPTPVPPEVLAATALPMIHHRSADFRAAFERVLDRLAEVYRTQNDVLLFTSAGTAAMESAVANLCSPGDRVLCVSHGYFGERWAEIAKGYGLDVDHLRYEWGETPNADEVGARLEEIGGAKVVYLTHSDTSTGGVADVQATAARIADSGALVAVDAISSLAAVPLETDEWGLDVVLTSSHKALMCPAGLAFAAISPAALEATETAASPRYYMDWRRAVTTQAKGETPFSTAISLVRGLDVALGMILEDGLEAAHERHLRLGRAARAGVKAMGLDLFSPDDDTSAVVTAIRMPADIDGQAIVAAMREESGVTIIGGQGQMRGKIVRFGHIGYVDVNDVTVALAALERALVGAGADVERGVAVAAAHEAHAEPVAA